MRRAVEYLPVLGLIVATAALFYAGVGLQEPGDVQRDRQARQAFAAAVKQGERPGIKARNMGGVLLQELDAQAAIATDRQREALWVQGAALFCLLCLGAALVSRGRPTQGEPGALTA